MHFFLEDISKHARVTQKKNFLICGRLSSQGPWPQRTKLGTNVAKGISCDIVVFFFFFPVNPPLSYSVEKRRDPKKSRDFFGPASSQHYNSGGGVHRKKKKENHYITANAFSYIRTEFGALRSRPLAGKPATN